VRLRALAACGRRVEALRALQAYREQLATETGLHPAGRFLELERTLVEDSAEPDRTATAPGAPARSTRPRAGAAVARGGVAWNGPLRNDTNLVGREAELRFVAEALSDASHGEPRALVIGGEAGIGKTRLLDAIARRGVDTGFDVVRGSAVGSRTGPLGALRDLVARFTPEISDDMGDSSDTTYTEVASAERRWSGHALTLADAIVQRARTHPTLLLADDVQSYDDVSVLALELMHGAVANALPNASERLLVVFAFRSIGVPEPVLARIGRMARAPRTAELRLRGLPESDVVQLVLNATGYPPTRALVDSAAESGNPLVTMSVLQSFAQAGALVVRDGYLDLQGSGQVAVPPDMRQVVSATLAPLEPRVRDAFIRLALLGDGVDLATAQSVLGWSEAEFRALLDEGERAGLLRIDINHVAFEHDVLRWAVTQSVPGATRRRMYAENAARLSADVDPDEVGGVLLLAEQLQLSGVRSSAARVGYWSELAGDHCLTRALWRDAIRYYDAAADAPDTDATQSAGLQLKSGLASFHHHDPWRARDRLLPLLEDDRPASAEDLGSAALAMHRAAFTLTSDQELVRRARDALMEFAERDDIDASLAGVRALALAQLAEETFGTQNTAEGRRLSDAARRVATSVDDAAVHARVGFSTGLVDLTDLRLTPALHAFELSARDAGTAHDPWFQAAALGRIGFATAMTGAVEHARTAVGRARELQHALRLWSELALTECTSGAIALVAGDADAARADAQQALRFCDQSGYQFAPALAYPTLVAAAARTGDHAGARQAIATWRTATPGGQTIFEMAALALAGEHQEVEERLRARPLRVPPFDRINLLTLPQLAASTTIALALRLHPQLAELLDRVDQLVDRGVYVTLGWPVFFPSVAAEIGAALDLEDRVRRAELARDAARELGAG
jgi:hypothetical protein